MTVCVAFEISEIPDI